MQSCQDLEQLVVQDLEGLGIPLMFANIQANLDQIMGHYVYILQDDDQLAGQEVIYRLRNFTEVHEWPPVIICRNIKRGLLLPDRWEQQPQEGHIDLGSYVIRSDVFKDNAGAFGARYAGDFDFINALWRAGYGFAWLDMVLAREQLQQPGLGRSEQELRR
jgi:hypothetical protein